ncbi:MAG: lysophospholipid acyltransferase family protein [Armatimonadota bacterium]
MLYRITWPLMKLFLRITFAVLGGFRRNGHKNVPKTGGVLLCPNHFSDADPAAVAVALPRTAWFMAKAELFDVPILGVLIRLWHGFPVKRDSADRSALRRAEELLKAGEAVVIFPEGGGNSEETLQPLHPGALMVALRAKVPVIPVALVNTGKMWTYGAPLPHRSGVPVSVVFGPPLDLSDLEGKRGAIEKATARLTETLAEMLGQPVPAGKPKRRDEEKDGDEGTADAPQKS